MEEIMFLNKWKTIYYILKLEGYHWNGVKDKCRAENILYMKKGWKSKF